MLSSTYHGDRLRPRRLILLALALSLGVVGWNYMVHLWTGAVQHESTGAFTHGVRDIAISLPVALAAVYVGVRVAHRLGLAGPGARMALHRASIVSLLFAVLAIPSVAVHHAIDTLLDGAQAHAGAGLEHDTSALGLLLHGSRDAMIGQAVGLPLMFAAFLLLGPARPRHLARRPLSPAAWPSALPRAVYAAVTVAFLGSAFVAGTDDFPGAIQPVSAQQAPDPCAAAPQRSYDVSAINVEITLNRFGVTDPNGMMYVLDQDIDAVRAQEASGEVSSGLGSDAIQPLVIRANLGDCLTINFTNRTTVGFVRQHEPPLQAADSECEDLEGLCDGQLEVGEPTPLSMHMHGVSYRPEEAAGSFVGNNPETFADPGETVSFTVFVDPALGEGSHTFHSHGDGRLENVHGLFGMLVAEPAGSQWLDPATLEPLDSGWNAVIRPTRGPIFREFALIYHEIGDEAYRGIMEADGVTQVPVVDPFTDAYRPCSKGINYRSECFFERLNLLDQQGFVPDESQQYGSYMNGDMATPRPEGYVGDPHKTRLMHAGAEMGHVHHYHGGAIRWPRNPRADGGTDIDDGLDKTPPQSSESIRLDSQTINPGEAYSLEHDCGMGGCQQAAGDYLFHCHIADHYIAGMLGFIRVFDTQQPGLPALPRRDAMPEAVNSAGLLGLQIEGETVVLAAELTDPETQVALEDLVESQLPPRGVRIDPEDATVWDWQRGGTPDQPVYLGEPEDTTVWPNYESPTPGERPEILFNPTNGRYAYPLLRPHLGQRPPFAPNNHSGAPWLGETGSAERPDGLCPADAEVREYNTTAIQTTITESNGGLTDPMVDENGQIFALNEDIEAIETGAKEPEPLAIRSNVGDCVALTLTSTLNDTPENRMHSKVNQHIHFVQFDPQASDGVITGLAFEQSVRPAQTENRTLAAPAAAGDTQIQVSNPDRLHGGEDEGNISIEIGQGEPNTEIAVVESVEGSTVTLVEPLGNDHAAGEMAGTEFVQYRWYSDVDSGTVFFHDHVDGIHSWGHGLFAAHIIEPPGSTYHDPVTGEEVRSGAIVDIHTDGSVGVGQQGSFREYMLWLHNGIRGDGDSARGCEGGSFNLRAAPFKERDPNPGDTFNLGFTALDEPAGADRVDCTDQINATDPYLFSSVVHGDPATPLLRAYAGDDTVIRTIGLVDQVGSLRFQGHRFSAERFNDDGTLTDAGTTGISERFDYVLDGGAGGPRRLPGDYLYYSSRSMEMESGAWGIFRVHDTRQDDLQPLPGEDPPTGPGFPELGVTGEAPPPNEGVGNACPGDEPVRSYDVSLFVTGQGDPEEFPDAVYAYALTEDVDDIVNETMPLVPLALRANEGECLEVNLTNQLPADEFTWNWGTGSTRAGFTAGNIVGDPQFNGVAIGFNPDSSIAPGETRTYQYFVDEEVGTSLALNMANNTSNARGGAYAAVIAEPRGASYTDPETGEELLSGISADIQTPDDGSFREFVTVAGTDEHDIGHSIMEYDPFTDDGHFNYVQESLFEREGIEEEEEEGEDEGEAPEEPLERWEVFSSTAFGEDPATVYQAQAGDPVRFRVAVPTGNFPLVFHLEGHAYPLDHDIRGSEVIDTRTVMPGQTFDAHLIRGAGGALEAPGDYLVQQHRLVFLQPGWWGLFRVLPPDDDSIVPLE
jgi:FtsP/CotA-like multicopper oxidase with cupredoxin domain